MRHPVTGEDVPDPSDQVPIYRYVNPRPAVWQEADYIVSNPPFIGKSRRRTALGDEYLECLFKAYPQMPDGADFVMYWWFHAINIIKQNKLKRFGFITTNSITQILNRQVISENIKDDSEYEIVWAIPDHPWVDTEGSAAVRIAMTVVGKREGKQPTLVRVIREERQDEDTANLTFEYQNVGFIHSNLRGGAKLDQAKSLQANPSICSVGLVLLAKDFLLMNLNATKSNQMYVILSYQDET